MSDSWNPTREEVIEGLKKVWDAFDHMEHELYADYVFDALKMLKEQGSREWIYCEDDSGQDGYRCSGCGFFEPWYYNYISIDFIKKYQFCPSCGAKMKERTK